MKRHPRMILLTLGRCLKLQCPVCGRASIVVRPFNIKSRCSNCHAVFQREEGFFVGAIMANVVATEVLILLIYFACLLLTDFDERVVLPILFITGVTFPLLFYHHSWALWLGMDYLIEDLPRDKKQ